jgi:predicted small metal-binding protein
MTRPARPRQLSCPCGEHVTGRDEDELVEKARAHLREKHPGREYTREEILFMAY